jgi:hypothetical protein
MLRGQLIPAGDRHILWFSRNQAPLSGGLDGREQTAMRIIPMSVVAAAFGVCGLVQVANAQAAKPLFVDGDLVRGNQKGAPGPGCVLDNQFKHLEKVTWRIRVRDGAGQALDDKGIKSLVVQLPDGQSFNAKFGPHPPPAAGPAVDHFWTAIWIIPSSYPSGSLSYKVVATDLDGNTQTWEPFKSKPSQLTVIDGDIEIKTP